MADTSSPRYSVRTAASAASSLARTSSTTATFSGLGLSMGTSFLLSLARRFSLPGRKARMGVRVASAYRGENDEWSFASRERPDRGGTSASSGEPEGSFSTPPLRGGAPEVFGERKIQLRSATLPTSDTQSQNRL